MMKYQEPEMDIIKLESADIITASGDPLYTSPDSNGDGSSDGGTGGGNYGDL